MNARKNALAKGFVLTFLSKFRFFIFYNCWRWCLFFFRDNYTAAIHDLLGGWEVDEDVWGIHVTMADSNSVHALDSNKYLLHQRLCISLIDSEIHLFLWWLGSEFQGRFGLLWDLIAFYSRPLVWLCLAFTNHLNQRVDDILLLVPLKALLRTLCLDMDRFFAFFLAWHALVWLLHTRRILDYLI